MSETTKIEWAEHTGGPWLVCSCVSPGCAFCYAMALMLSRLGHVVRKAYKLAGFADWESRPVWGEKATRVLTRGFWEDARRINAAHGNAGTRGRWFPSMIDWLDGMPAGIIDQDGKRLDRVTMLTLFLRLIFETPHLDWLLLTKRPENFWGSEGANGGVYSQGILESVQDSLQDSDFKRWLCLWGNGTAPANVWVGVSVEDQTRADERIPQLLRIPAKVRFLSVEPMLGPIEFSDASGRSDAIKVLGKRALSGIDWAIFGGESGPGARACNVKWIRSGVKQCQAAGVKVFVKQLGSNVPVKHNDEPYHHKKGGDPAEWPADLRVREFPQVDANAREGEERE